MRTRRGTFVSTLTPEQKKRLSIKVVSEYNGFSKQVQCWRKHTEGWLIPSFYNIDFHNILESQSISDVLSIDVPFRGQLLQKQESVCSAAIDHMSKRFGGMLCLPTGFGKTVVALYLISMMKVKTLIVVHKDFLKQQWIERINRFLPSASIGVIQGNTIDNNKDIVIGMIQSLSMKDYDIGVFKGFGLCIIDEAHHCPAETFSNIFFTCSCRYMLGLTATPTRKDGLHRLYSWFVGDIIVHIENEHQLQVSVETLPFWDKEFLKPEPLSVNGELNIGAMITGLTTIGARNATIISKVLDLVRQGRNILVLSDRRNHCLHLYQTLLGHRVDVGLYIGSMKKEEYKESSTKQVIVATYSLVSEGFDIPRLDTVVLSTPRSDVIQSVGRVMRTGDARKFDPYIIDICDRYSIFFSQARKRENFYRSAKFSFLQDQGECLITDD